MRAVAAAIFAIWLAGVVYGFVRFCRGGLALRRLLKMARPGDDDERLRPILAQIERHLGLKKMPPVLLWRDAKLQHHAADGRHFPAGGDALEKPAEKHDARGALRSAAPRMRPRLAARFGRRAVAADRARAVLAVSARGCS